MTRATQWVGVAGALALGVGGFVALQALRPEPAKVAEEPRPVALFVEPVRERRVALDVHTQGEVRAKTEMELVAEVSGRIVAVAPEFVAGGSIEPGAVLLAIDDTDYRFAVTRAESGVAEARVKLEQIRADAAVARRQLTPATATPLGLREPQLADAEARLRAAEADLAKARLDLGRTQLRLPFRGRLRETAVGLGEFVAVGTPLGRAFSTDVAEVRLPLTDQQLASLGLPIGYVAAEGEGAAVELSAVVGGEGRSWHGRITRLDAAVDPGTRLLHALAEVDEPYGAAATQAGMPLAVGLFVDARIRGRAVEAARVIPRVALRQGDSVYVVAGGELSIRRVSVLHEDAEEVVLAGGVEAGEAVVISPVRSPVNGMRVQGVNREVVAERDSSNTTEDDPA